MIAPQALRLPCAGILALTLLSISACRKSAPAPSAESSRKAWPAGTVLAMNDVPILAEEVDRIGSDFALLEPQDALFQLRRLAVADVLVPLIAVQDVDPERRARARELAETYRKALVSDSLPSGPLAGPMEVERSGPFKDLGFALWRQALPLQTGTWSEVFESPGSFHLLRVKSREEGSLPSLTRFTIGFFSFPYLDVETARADIDAAIDRSHLVIVDDAWRDAVPAALRYRLHAENP